MLAAERHEELVPRQDFRRDATDFLHQGRELAEGKLHLGQREDPDGMDVRTYFLVPELHVRGRLQNLAWAIAGAWDVGSRPVHRNRKHDGS